MRAVVASAAAAIVLTVGLRGAAYGYVWGGVETGSDLHIAGMYTTREACVAEGRELSRRRSPPGCNYGACHFYTYCITLESNPW
jgi:hypothetical protein